MESPNKEVEGPLLETLLMMTTTPFHAGVLLMYSVQLLGDTAQVNFTFSSPQTLNNTRCFFDKLILFNGESTISPTFTSYQPLYPGLCQDTVDSYQVIGFMDPRDFRPSLPFFNNIDGLFIQLVPGMEIDFLPRVSLFPINGSLPASELRFNLDISVESFDVDWNANRVVLHFTDYVDLLSFDSMELTLTDPVNGNSYTLSNYSMPEMPGDNLIRTVCVVLGERDLERLRNESICSTIPESCACYFTSSLVSSHSNISVQEVSRLLPLPVSSLHCFIRSV